MFKKGQKIICITKFRGININDGQPSTDPLPVVDQIYTFTGETTNEGFLLLQELGVSGYDPSKFAPLEEWENASKAVAELMKDLSLQLN